MRPIWERTFSDIPERTQLLLWRSSDTWYAMLAVCEGNIRADLGRLSTDGCGCGRPPTRWASPGWMGCWALPPCPMIHIGPSMNACALPSHGRISACVPNAHSRRNLPGLDGVRGIRSGRTSANGQSSPKWRNSVARTYQYPGCCLTMDGPMSIGRMARCARSVRIQAASPKDFRTPCVC